MRTCSRRRVSGFTVVSHSCSGFISPRPLKRWMAAALLGFVEQPVLRLGETRRSAASCCRGRSARPRAAGRAARAATSRSGRSSPQQFERRQRQHLGQVRRPCARVDQQRRAWPFAGRLHASARSAARPRPPSVEARLQRVQLMAARRCSASEMRRPSSGGKSSSARSTDRIVAMALRAITSSARRRRTSSSFSSASPLIGGSPSAGHQTGAFDGVADQVGVERRVVLQVQLVLALLDLVQRRQADVDVAALDQLRHLPVEEGEQQGADVRAVDVGVGHQDDAVVAQLVRVVLVLADAGAERGDQRADFGARRACGRSARARR